MRSVLGDALIGLRARRGRTALAAGGVFAASLVLGVVAIVLMTIGNAEELERHAAETTADRNVLDDLYLEAFWPTGFVGE